MIYAMGDINGCLDRFNNLLEKILVDAGCHQIQRPRLIILGDFIDRGPASKDVLDVLVSPSFQSSFEATVLLGNHEDWLLRLFDGDLGGLLSWLHHGGGGDHRKLRY